MYRIFYNSNVQLKRFQYGRLNLSNICAKLPRLTQPIKRYSSSLPERTDKHLTSNTLRSRIPKFPFGKDVQPTIIPKPDTPRVGKDMNFGQLIMVLKSSKEPELLYMAESHRLYFITALAFGFVACYNLFDLADRAIKEIKDDYYENEEDLSPTENKKRVWKRGALTVAFCSIYATAAFLFLMMPSRLIRRIEYLPGPKEHIRLVTHPVVPGRLSPVYTVPIENLTIGKRSKVWTGAGFYGTANKSSYFFFLFEKGHWLPWIVDRNGWFWGDGRVYDVLFGKEPIEIAEKGYSYDDILNIQMSETAKKKAELRRELGPAWKLKMAGQLMKEDGQRIRDAARRAVMGSIKGRNDQLEGSEKKQPKLVGSEAKQEKLERKEEKLIEDENGNKNNDKKKGH